MMRRASAIFISLFLATATHAATIRPLPEWGEQDGWLVRFARSVEQCTWRIPCYFRTRFGASITTINATDRISDSRTTINDNFTSLNNYKIENSSTSVAAITTLANLTSVGALSSGSLASGFTTVTVPLGGTGSTTLARNQILLGDGSSAIKVASSTGASGQFLQSQGPGAPPLWANATVDEAAAYNWTNNHTQTASSTWLSTDGSSGAGINVNATTTTGTLTIQNGFLSINGVTYRLQTGLPSNNASSTVLLNDGNGQLSWGFQDWTQVGETISTTTRNIMSVNNLPTRKAYRIDFFTPGTSAVTSELAIVLNADRAANYSYYETVDDFSTAGNNTASSSAAFFGVTMSVGLTTSMRITADMNNISTSQKHLSWNGQKARANATTAIVRTNGNGVWYDATNNITTIEVAIGDGSGTTFNTGTRLTIWASRD